jgi:hypothetical protein
LIKGFGIGELNGIISFQIALNFFRSSTKLMVSFASSTRQLWVKLYKISLFSQNILSLTEKFDFTFFEIWWSHLTPQPRKRLVKLNKIKYRSFLKILSPLNGKSISKFLNFDVPFWLPALEKFWSNFVRYRYFHQILFF